MGVISAMGNSQRVDKLYETSAGDDDQKRIDHSHQEGATQTGELSIARPCCGSNLGLRLPPAFLSDKSAECVYYRA